MKHQHPALRYFRLLTIHLILLFCFIASTAASAAVPTFDGAQWVWHQGANNAAGTWYFQKGFAFPAGQKPKTAHVAITCDNLWALYVNGEKVGQGDPDNNSWQRPQSVDVTKHLVIEKNAIAIEGTNTIAGPAGLLVKLAVEFEDGEKFELTTDKTWISADKPQDGWKDNGFVAGPSWKPAAVIGPYGVGPWNKVAVGGGKAPRRPAQQKSLPLTTDEEELKKPIYQPGVVFVGDAVGLNVNRQPIYHQNIKKTRAYFEMDPPTPAALGRTLWSLVPLRPDGKKTLLCDAGMGTVGSPSVSYDGKTVYFTMVKPDEAYFHLYKVDMTGTGDKAPGQPASIVQLTDGPFHDYDPMELPDGRIAFSSTRLGSREEYHGKYASCLFTCSADGKDIRPLTYHIVADREPRVMADGSLVFIRSDNFLERAKVETHLHQTRIDGTAGQVIIGPGRKGIQLDRDVAAEPHMRWLRNYGVGSPAPLPDGRVAAINQSGLVTSANATGQRLGNGFLPFDLSPLPDGRLLCTSHPQNQIIVFDPADSSRKAVFSQDRIHSVVHLGPRRRPMTRPSLVDPRMERSIDKTGYLYCQNVLDTQHTSADTRRIKAIRVYEGRPFTLDPTKTIYAHIGTVGRELGTVPIAADGSVYVEVPADRPLALQAIDGEGRPVINELSWIYTRPGEQRACVGCHAPVDSAPPATPGIAIRSRPLKLTGQGEPHLFRANNGANGGIVNLQLDKFREVTGINLHDVPDDQSLSTIRRLGILRNRSAVSVLVEALDADSDELRVAAILSLSACGNRDAVEPLMGLLGERNPIVARAAANALHHLTGNPRGGTDWAAIESALIARLAGDDPQDVQMAIEALGHVGGEAGCTAIRDYLKNHPNGELRILMAAMRSLGYLQDRRAIPQLVAIIDANLNRRGKGGWNEGGFNQKPVYMTATAVEALGRIGGKEAEDAILAIGPRLGNFETHVMASGEHGWLRSAQPSPIYFRMLEALDRVQSTGAGPLAAALVKSIPTDKDRGLLYQLDTYEKLVGRVVEQSGRMNDVVEACFSVLGETPATEFDVDPTLQAAVSHAPHNEGHIRRHSPQARAAQVLSIVCNDVKYAGRIRGVLQKYRAAEASETRAWCCFMLTRTLGRLGDRDSIGLLIEMLEKDPTEASYGLNPPPTHIIYKAWRPFYRPAAAWSLGQMRAGEAAEALLAAVENLDNASSTRQQAAIALGRIGDKSALARLEKIAENYPELTTRRSLLESIKKMSK